MLVGHMFLELDDVTVGDGLGVDRGQDGSGVSVDGLCAEGRNGGGSSVDREAEDSDAFHCERGWLW